MKTVVVLAALVGLTVAGSSPPTYKTKSVDQKFVQQQTKVLHLLESIGQNVQDAEWYEIGKAYDIEANIDNYTDRVSVMVFSTYLAMGFMPKQEIFSVFYDTLREEAIVLFKLFFYAKDFDTFYKTAAYARVHFNEGQFLYAFYVSLYQRPDTQNFVLPAPYEMFPQYFVDSRIMRRAYNIKMQNSILDPAFATQYGITYENDNYVFYSNYSSPWFTGSEEQKLSYFTEDIGMNSFYYFMQIISPFWLNERSLKSFKELRGEMLYFNYQQLIAQYYLERLSNGLGEIPEFSWDKPIETGYTCQLVAYYPFFQRNDYYQIDKVENDEYLQWIKNYERNFLSMLEKGHFKAYDQEVDFRNSTSMNFVSNYWFATLNLLEKFGPRNYQRYYEIIGLHLLAGTPERIDKYTIFPSALELYQTSLRDPVFYQFYKRILNYIIQYKEYLEPYDYYQLHFKGVKISDIKVEKLVTFFEFFDFDISNELFFSKEEFNAHKNSGYKVRQPRLNHKPFTVTVDVKSEITTDAVFKIFLGPKYDSNGYPLSIENNWMNFVELDWFVQKLTPGENKIERKSHDFVFYKDDSVSVPNIFKLLAKGEVPLDMSENFWYKPNRMMLPKGTVGGYPFQIYVVAYPHTALPKELEVHSKHLPDTKPLSYPFDRPVFETFFDQPNIYYKDVLIYHEGEDSANDYNFKGYYNFDKVTPKH